MVKYKIKALDICHDPQSFVRGKINGGGRRMNPRWTVS